MIFCFVTRFYCQYRKKNYTRVFSKECKYAVKKKKIINTINKELNLSESDDQYDNDTSKESDED